MSEMIERVAKAIAWADLEDDQQARNAAGSQELIYVEPKYFELARAAIAAMREPTEAQIQAALEIDPDQRQYVDEIPPAVIYRAMIDAAQK